MGGLKWIEIDTDLPEHKKSIRLGLLLGDVRAWTYVAQLFLWCARNDPHGRFEGDEGPAMLAFSAGWIGDASRFADALISAGFVERLDGALVVHDLAERLAAHIAQREKDAKRQRTWRKKVAKRYGNVTRDAPVTSEGRTATVQGNSNSNSNSNKKQKLASPPAPIAPAEAPRWPLVVTFNRALAERRARPPLPIVGKKRPEDEPAVAAAIELEVSRLGMASAVEAAFAHDVEHGPGHTLAWFVEHLRELPTPAPDRGPGEDPKPGDPDFNDAAAWSSMQAFYNRDARAA